ncbi:discoidin domain-containing protein [Patescibacteria group bacterium]|nr:discoidin domain-containing protein [Patescibacteria group bacterium]
MATCPHCNSEQSSDTDFCTNCGTRLTGEGAQNSSSKDESNVESKEEGQDESLKEDDTHEKEEAHKDPASDKENEKEEIESKNDSESGEDNKEVSEGKEEISSESTEKEKDSKKEENTDGTDNTEEDPFAYSFDDEDKPKRSTDGIWFAIIAIIVVVVIIVIGTQKKRSEFEEDTAEDVVLEEMQDTDEEEVVDDAKQDEEEKVDESEESEEAAEEQKEPEVKEEVVVSEPGYSVSASTTLVDTSAYNFDYSAKKVTDKDFSTAWIEDERDAGIGEWVLIDFGAEKEVSNVGIVPGYGRDEQIYNENNRVKKLTLEFSDGTKVTKDLEDKYGMHILTFDPAKTTSLKLTIDEVYSGTKYNDTTISEIDVDSDYVLNNDPEAALNYYKENKANSAKKAN